MLAELFTAVHNGFSNIHQRLLSAESKTGDELSAIKARLSALEKPFDGLTSGMLNKIHESYGRGEQNLKTGVTLTSSELPPEAK